MMLTLRETASALNAQLAADGALAFGRVTTDSRDVRPGDLFIALRGERFDAHDFVEQALADGAVAALVETEGAGNRIIVKDTLAALGQLAAHWRQLHRQIPLIAVTGSNGKTSVKEMLVSIATVACGDATLVHATCGNLNNHIGLPLTVLGIRPEHRYVIAEMGMNHFGEIDYLTRIACPDVALVNNAGAAHLEALGSVEGVARAKGEIFAGLAENGVAVINRDDAHAAIWQVLAGKHRRCEFGLMAGDVHASAIQATASGSRFTLHAQGATADAELVIPGIHNVRNALAASAAAISVDIPIEKIAAGLTAWVGVKGRLQPKRAVNGARIMDDTYNANPDSMRAAIDVLAAQEGDGLRILVLGDIGEIGDDGIRLHAALGRYAQEQGIDRLLALGELMQHAVSAFGNGAQHFADHASLLAHLRDLADPRSVVLVKGSRFMKMETIVDGLVNEQGAQPCC